MESASTPALLLLDLPPSALAGIDLLSFTVTPRFRGIKDLPYGLHFVFTGTSAAFSERHGLWINVVRPDTSTNAREPLLIAKWDAAHETLVEESDPTEHLRWRANLGELWREKLAPYRQSSGRASRGGQNQSQSQSQSDMNENENENDWTTLTSCITPALLSRISGGSDSSWTLGSGSSALQDVETIPGLSATDAAEQYAEGQILHFFPINLKQTWRPGATGRERTEAAQDRSWALLNLSGQGQGQGNLDEVIGEMQFCFLMLLTLNNFSCLEQWKRILEVIFTSTAAVEHHSEFFVRAIAALRLQLQHCKDAEAGLIDLADESGSLLSSLLIRFRRGVERLSATGAVADVIEELDDLEDYLRDHHGWQFGGTFARSGVLDLEDGEQVRAMTTAYDEDDEIGEFAPQIVELTAEQAKLLGEEGSTLEHDQEVVIEGTDWGVRRPAGIGKGIYVEDNTVQGFVVEEDDSDDDDDDDDRDESHAAHKNDSDEEDLQDLEDMDSRY